jgi:hypothetical protein
MIATGIKLHLQQDMVVVFNTRRLQQERNDRYSLFVNDCLLQLATDHPQDKFVFLIDRPGELHMNFLGNITTAVLRGGKRPLARKLWYDIRLPALLRKLKADVFVSFDEFCSMTAELPQCLVLTGAVTKENITAAPTAIHLFLKYYTPRFLKKADCLVTFSKLLSTRISAEYSIPAEKFRFIPFSTRPEFREMDSSLVAMTKEKYTGGREYFVFAGQSTRLADLLNLLKAFSGFKKMQNSNWKLLLAFRAGETVAAFRNKLSSFRYRDDVIIVDYSTQEELARLVGAGYCIITLPGKDYYLSPELDAMQAGVAVITMEDTGNDRDGNDARLYAGTGNYKDLADQMMRIYKDERLRARLVERGKTFASQHSIERSAADFWEVIHSICVNCR